MKRNGTLSSNIGVATSFSPSNLKQLLLLFDQVAFLATDAHIAVLRSLATADEKYGYVANEIEFCADRGLILNIDNLAFAADMALKYGLPEFEYQRYLAAVTLMNEYRELVSQRGPNEIGYVTEAGSLTNFEAYCFAWVGLVNVAGRIISHKLRLVDGLDAVAVFENSEKALKTADAGESGTFASVAQVILEKIPTPSDKVPWEQILEFREDPDAAGFLRGLRVWMHEAATKNLPQNQLQEKLEWLLFTREKTLQSHKMDYNVDAFGSVFVATAEMLENLVKINWGKAARTAVSLATRKARLSKLEIDSPQQELHYLLMTQQKFSGD